MHRLAWTFAALAVGCASMSDVVAEKQRGGGTSQRYPVPSDVAFELSRDVLRSEGADAIEEHKSDGFMLTSSGASVITDGTYMGVWVAADGANSLVTVITKRKIATSAVTTLTEDGFHRRFAQMVMARVAQKPASPAAAVGVSCAASSDCTGALPQDCVACPAGQHGGCLHWVCLSGQCLTRNCDPN